jgi:hypothetical protein
MVKTGEGGNSVEQRPERWWMDWGAEAGEGEGEDDLLEPTSLWEAEITALDDEQLMALEDSGEDV